MPGRVFGGGLAGSSTSGRANEQGRSSGAPVAASICERSDAIPRLVLRVLELLLTLADLLLGFALLLAELVVGQLALGLLELALDLFTNTFHGVTPFV
jgi:hypothetical protein